MFCILIKYCVFIDDDGMNIIIWCSQNMMYTIPFAVHKGTIICRTVIQIYFRDNPVYYFLFDHGSHIFPSD